MNAYYMWDTVLVNNSVVMSEKISETWSLCQGCLSRMKKKNVVIKVAILSKC